MKNYIKVPFADKDKVKAVNGRWDNDMKSWYIPEGEDESKFSKWEKHDPSIKTENLSTGTRIYLNVPFSEKDEVKNAKGRWDNDKKQWYYLSDQDSSAFSKWFAAEQPTQNAPAKIGNKPPQQSQPKNNNSGGDDLDSDLDAILSLGDD